MSDYEIHVPTQEEAIKFVEESNIPVGSKVTCFIESCPTVALPDDDEDYWYGTAKLPEREQHLKVVRKLATNQPHIFRALKLYKDYTIGQGFTIGVKPHLLKFDELSTSEMEKNEKVKDSVRVAWEHFLYENRKGWSLREFVTRLYRDGEQFTRIVDKQYPPKVRFIDPEIVKDDPGSSDEDKGIKTKVDDVTEIESYNVCYDPNKGTELTADEVVFTKIDVDSNEKRGQTRFKTVINSIIMYSQFVKTEITHRNSQASIILIRKVAGGRAEVQGVIDNAQTATTNYGSEGTTSREKWRPGTIITTNKNVEMEFVQPEGNFTDASPLARLLLQQVSAATGWTYAMLSCDPGDQNFAQALVAESPVMQMIGSEREFLAQEFTEIFRMVMTSALAAGEIEGYTADTEDQFWEDYEIDFRWPSVVSRDALKDAQAANIGKMAGALSDAEVSRRMQADPELMQREIEQETQKKIEMGLGAMPGTMNPDITDKQASSASNAQSGMGTNQGGAMPTGHDDALT